jgi:hypothetical protein
MLFFYSILWGERSSPPNPPPWGERSSPTPPPSNIIFIKEGLNA